MYVVSADAKGFGKSVSARFKVDINENATTNLTLKVAGANQTVQVTGEAQAIQTQDAETGQVINRRFINDLPLIDRNVIELVYLAPGVTEMDDQCDVTCTGTNFVSNGSRGSTSDILTDGASVTNSEPNGGITAATYLPSPEAVEEFKVEQTNFSAEYGFSGASVVNMITRSGTNKFHGSGYDFVRDAIFDANNWFATGRGSRFRLCGATITAFTFGGPIIKNKTFFFFDYDGLRSTGLGTGTVGVPTDAMRNQSDFGEVCLAQGNTDDNGAFHPGRGTRQPEMRTTDGACRPMTLQKLWRVGNSSTRTNAPTTATWALPWQMARILSFPSIKSASMSVLAIQTCLASLEPTPGVAGNLIDPVAQKMLQLYPEPNMPQQGIYYNWFGSGPSKNYNDQFDIKVDHRFNEKNLVSVKYSYQYSHGVGLNCFKNFTDPCQGGPGWTNAHLFAINDTHTFTPTLLLNVTFGFTRGVVAYRRLQPSRCERSSLHIGVPVLSAEQRVSRGARHLYKHVCEQRRVRSTGTDPYGNYRLGQDTGQLSATLDKVHGQHELKFGFEGRLHQMNYIQTNAPVGIFSFDESGSAACLEYTINISETGIAWCGGDSFASFLMGNHERQLLLRNPVPPGHRRTTSTASSARTTGRSTPKLTLNLGLRYDVTLPRTDRYNRQNWFDPTVTSPLNGGSLSYTDPVSGATVHSATDRAAKFLLIAKSAYELCDRLARLSAALRLRLSVCSRRWWSGAAMEFTSVNPGRASPASCRMGVRASTNTPM